MIWVRRAAFLGIALVMTAIAFHFWGKFAGAMNSAMKAESSTPAAPVSNEVTIGIIPAAPQKPACDKKHPCP
jgi:hypothetical protein